MKKLLAFLLVLLMCVPALAEEVIELPDAVVTCEVPQGMYVLTRESSASAFNRLGLSQREVLPIMEAEGIYAILYDMAEGTEIHISAGPVIAQGFDEMTGDEFEQICQEYRTFYEGTGVQFDVLEGYCSTQGMWFISSLVSQSMADGSVRSALEYYTCQAGYALCVSVYPADGIVTAERMARGQAVADSLRVKAQAIGQVRIPLTDAYLDLTPFRGGVCLTQESDAELYEDLGIDRDAELRWMAENNVCAVLVDGSGMGEVQVTVKSADYPDFNLCTPKQDAALLETLVEAAETDSYIVLDTGMHDNGHHRFAWMTYQWANFQGVQESRVYYLTGWNDYMIEVVVFVHQHDALDDYAALVRELVDSLRFTLREDVTQLTRGEVSLQFAVPERMRLHASAEEAGVTPPEATTGEIAACMTADEADWFILWQLNANIGGDADHMSDSAIRALYEARARNKKRAGCTVTLSADFPAARQRYIRTDYHFTDANGDTWYAVECYTKQSAWGVSVTAYSPQPLTEDMLATLESIVNSQLIIRTE
ncbi:MAG: hypothetical protein IJE07_04935 [Clostridia bacterium]|nr:hypothetical protein [Clostridia bacterium]